MHRWTFQKDIDTNINTIKGLSEGHSVGRECHKSTNGVLWNGATQHIPCGWPPCMYYVRYQSAGHPSLIALLQVLHSQIELPESIGGLNGTSLPIRMSLYSRTLTCVGVGVL